MLSGTANFPDTGRFTGKFIDFTGKDPFEAYN